MFIGPCLIHYRKNFDSFFFLPIPLYLGEDDLKLFDALEQMEKRSLLTYFCTSLDSLFTYMNIATFMYVQTSRMNFIRGRFVNSVVHVHEFVGEIFGKQVESAYCEGLVDAKSEADFYHELEELRKKWSAREE